VAQTAHHHQEAAVAVVQGQARLARPDQARPPAAVAPRRAAARPRVPALALVPALARALALRLVPRELLLLLLL